MSKLRSSYSSIKDQLKVLGLCCLLFVACKSNEPELNNPTSPTSKTSPSGADPGYSSVTTTIAGPYTANGVDEIIVDVVMKDSQNRSLYQVTPGFDITNTDNKNIILCTPSNLAGESRCKIRSTRAEVKTIKLNFPFKQTLGTATFVHDVPAAIGIYTQPSTYGMANVALPGQPVAQVLDAYGNPVFTAVNPLTVNFYSDANCTTASAGTMNVTTNPVVGDGSTSLYPFAGLRTTLAATHYIGFTSAGLVSACTRAVEVVNDLTYETIFVTEPSATAVAGELLAQLPVVRIVDQFGNTAFEGGVDDAVVTLRPYTDSGCTTLHTTGTPGLVGDRPLSSDNGLSIQASSAQTVPFQIRAYRRGALYLGASAPGVPTSGCSSLITVSPTVVDETETDFWAGAEGVAGRPTAANGIHISSVRIILRDQYRNPVQGIVPTFSTDGSNNTQSACGNSNASGSSTCTLRSTTVEVKNLTLLTPVSKTTTSNFITPPDAAFTTINGTSPTYADGSSSSTITITLRDASNVAVPGIRPSFTASGTGNTVGTCGLTNGAGESTCTLRSTVAEDKTLTITIPFTMAGGSVTFVPGPVSGLNSSIVGTGPVVADDVATSSITITLRDSTNNLVSGQTPTFSATDTGGTNSYSACSISDLSGVSTCTMRSQKAEVKTLQLDTPAVTTGGDVTFVAGAATVGNSSITGTTPIYANGTAASEIEIELFDQFLNPLEGEVPTFSATNGVNNYGACSAVNALGISQCTMSSAVAGLKDLEVTGPISVPGPSISFSAVALIEPAPISALEDYGAVSVDTSKTYVIINKAAHLSGLLSVDLTSADLIYWNLTTNGCTGEDLAKDETCSVQITFLGDSAPNGNYTATLTVSSANAGDVVLNLEAERLDP